MYRLIVIRSQTHLNVCGFCAYRLIVLDNIVYYLFSFCSCCWLDVRYYLVAVYSINLINRTDIYFHTLTGYEMFTINCYFMFKRGRRFDLVLVWFSEPDEKDITLT